MVVAVARVGRLPGDPGLRLRHVDRIRPVADARADVERLRLEIDGGVRAFGAQIGGDVVRGPLPASLGGLPGYEWRLVFAGDRQRTRWVYGYNGRTLHYVECGADTSDARDAESGCERIVDTFTLVRD